MSTLLVSWSSTGKLTLLLEYRGKTSHLHIADKHLDQVLLFGINSIYKKQRIPFSSLKRIGVVKQEMSLASLRLLLSAVNSLAWALNLSVVWISQKQFDHPESIKWPKRTVLLKPKYTRPAVIEKRSVA